VAAVDEDDPYKAQGDVIRLGALLSLRVFIALVAVSPGARAAARATRPAGMVTAGDAVGVWWRDGRLVLHRSDGAERVARAPLAEIRDVVTDGDGFLLVGANAEGRGTVALIMNAQGSVVRRWPLPGEEIFSAASHAGRRWLVSSRGLLELTTDGVELRDAGVPSSALVLFAGAKLIICTRDSGGTSFSSCEVGGPGGWRVDVPLVAAPIVCWSHFVERARDAAVIRFTEGDLAGQEMNQHHVQRGAALACGLPDQLLIAGDRIETIDVKGGERLLGPRLRPGRPVQAVALVAGRVAVLEDGGDVRFFSHPLLVPRRNGGNRDLVTLGNDRFALWREDGAFQIAPAHVGGSFGDPWSSKRDSALRCRLAVTSSAPLAPTRAGLVLNEWEP
jgi:hypothetical protein